MTPFEVIGKTEWEVHWSGLNNPSGGSWGQLTKCRFQGVVFYVRENLAGRDMTMCSSARLGLKTMTKSSLPQVLELLAPDELWDELAEMVREVDSQHRPVRRNRRFTWAWAARQFTQGDNRVEHLR